METMFTKMLVKSVDVLDPITPHNLKTDTVHETQIPSFGGQYGGKTRLMAALIHPFQ